MAKPLGLVLPLEIGSNGYFRITSNPVEQVSTNLQNLLLTKIGERPMQPDFGSDLHKVVFENQTDDGLANIRGAIETATKKWLPFVRINNVEVTRTPNQNKILVKITFSVQTNVGMTSSITLVF